MRVDDRLVESVTCRLRTRLNRGLLNNLLLVAGGGGPRRLLHLRLLGHQDGSLRARIMHNNARVDVGATNNVGPSRNSVRLLRLVVPRRTPARLTELVHNLRSAVGMGPRLISIQIRVVI